MEIDYPTREVREGLVTLLVPDVPSPRGPGSRSALPFYNPTMEIARDVSVLLVQLVGRRGASVLDGLAATGVLGLRIALESGIESRVTLNDRNPRSVTLMKENARRTGAPDVAIAEGDLNVHLAMHHYDLVEIDPFGSPVPFLDAALQSAHRGSVLGVTATDTPVLCGAKPGACARRYLVHVRPTDAYAEVGLRILIGFVARMAGRFDKAVEPLFAYAAEHFLRAYLRISEGAQRADRALGSLGWIQFDSDTGRCESADEIPMSGAIGPLWLGPLVGEEVIVRLEPRPYMGAPTARLLDAIRHEAGLPPFYLENNATAGRLGVSPPRLEVVLDRLRENGFRAAPTHFRRNAFKTDAPWDEIRRVYEGAGR